MKTQTQSDVDFNSVIGLKIKARRRELKLTQTELANSLGVTFQQIQKYEKGKNRIVFPKLILLFKALNVKFAELDFMFADVQPTSKLSMQQERTNDVEHN